MVKPCDPLKTHRNGEIQQDKIVVIIVQEANRLLLTGSLALLISTSEGTSGFLFAFVAVFLSALWLFERGRLVYRMRSLEGLLAASSGEAGEDLYIRSRYEERSMSFRGRLLSIEPTLWIYLSLATLAAKVFWGV